MKLKKLFRSIMLIGLLSSPVLTIAQSRFEWSTPLDSISEWVFRLELDRAEDALIKLRSKDRNNVAYDYIQSDIDLIRFMNEERPEDKVRLFKNIDDLLKEISDLPKENSRRATLLAEVYLKRGFVHLSTESNLSAAMDIYRSYNQYEYAYLQDSLAPSAMIGWGVMQLIMGAIPENYQWYANLIGLTGDIEKGQEILERLNHSDRGNYLDKLHARFTSGYVTLNLESRQPLEVSKSEALKYPLFLFLKVSQLNQEGKGGEALALFSDYKKRKIGITFWYLEYVYGKTLLRSYRPEAEDQLLFFVQNYPGHNYVKSAYLYLSWYYLLEGDNDSYRLYTDQIKIKGDDFTGADKQAIHESQIRPLTPLLKVRLSFDAGDLNQAEGLLDSMEPALFSNTLNIQLWHYYKARIHERRGETNGAINEFKKAIETPFDNRTYIVPASCVKLGIIYRDNQDWDEAKRYFDRSLEYNDYPYATSYQRQAKNELKQLK